MNDEALWYELLSRKTFLCSVSTQDFRLQNIFSFLKQFYQGNAWIFNTLLQNYYKNGNIRQISSLKQFK